VVASGANLSVTASQVSDALLDEAELLVLQQEIPLEENLQLAIRASRKGLRVVFNLAPARDVPDDLLESVDMLVVNEVEAVFLAGGHSVEDMSLLAGALASRHDFSVVITLGSDGAVVAPGGNAGSFSVKAPQVNVTDTTGAGDTFTGYLAARLAQGNLVLEKCVSEAICAASLACTKAGAQAGIPYSSEVSKSTSFRV
jgi:ribokinase